MTVILTVTATALTISATAVSITFCYLVQYIVEGGHVLNEDLDYDDEI